MLLPPVLLVVVALLSWGFGKPISGWRRTVLTGAGVLGMTFVFWVLMWVRRISCFPGGCPR